MFPGVGENACLPSLGKLKSCKLLYSVVLLGGGLGCWVTLVPDGLVSAS
jgi:hypothetical protein